MADTVVNVTVTAYVNVSSTATTTYKQAFGVPSIYVGSANPAPLVSYLRNAIGSQNPLAVSFTVEAPFVIGTTTIAPSSGGLTLGPYVEIDNPDFGVFTNPESKPILLNAQITIQNGVGAGDTGQVTMLTGGTQAATILVAGGIIVTDGSTLTVLLDVGESVNIVNSSDPEGNNVMQYITYRTIS